MTITSRKRTKNAEKESNTLVMPIISLSNDPGKVSCEVDSNFFCYAATVLSPHRNVLIFTQRMHNRGTQRQFSENICSEEDLRSRIFGTFVVKFIAFLPLLGFSNIPKMV